MENISILGFGATYTRGFMVIVDDKRLIKLEHERRPAVTNDIRLFEDCINIRGLFYWHRLTKPASGLGHW